MICLNCDFYIKRGTQELYILNSYCDRMSQTNNQDLTKTKLENSTSWKPDYKNAAIAGGAALALMLGYEQYTTGSISTVPVLGNSIPTPLYYGGAVFASSVLGEWLASQDFVAKNESLQMLSYMLRPVLTGVSNIAAGAILVGVQPALSSALELFVVGAGAEAASLAWSKHLQK